jgi:hypothetical protein
MAPKNTPQQPRTLAEQFAAEGDERETLADVARDLQATKAELHEALAQVEKAEEVVGNLKRVHRDKQLDYQRLLAKFNTLAAAG